jgi:hypothetical protein
MKKLALVCSLIVFSQFSFAEESKSFNIVYGAHGGGFGFGPGLSYAVNENIAIGIVSESASMASGSVTAKSSGFGANARYYMEAALNGPYVSGYFIMGGAEGSSTTESVKMDATSIGATFGNTWMWDGFNLDAGIGMRSMSLGGVTATSGLDTSSLENSLSGMGLSLSFSAGYAF